MSKWLFSRDGKIQAVKSPSLIGQFNNLGDFAGFEEKAGSEMASVLSFGVGEDSPFPRVPLGATAVMTGVDLGVLAVTIQLPDVTDEDRSFMGGDIQGIGWLQTEEYPVGYLMLILSNGSEQWPIASPIGGHPTSFKAWGGVDREDNAGLIVLVDSNTNKVVSIRNFGLPSGLLHDLRDAARNHAHADIGKALAQFGNLSENKQLLWNSCRKWVYDAGSEEFVEH